MPKHIAEEHENTEKYWKPGKYPKSNPNHKFFWKALLSAPENIQIRKNLEASLIALK